MEVAPGDLFDRLSIVKLKSERLDSRLVEDELQELTEAFEQTCRDHEALAVSCADMVELLQILNGQIWDLEADIRKGKEGELGLEEVGRRAIAIRNLNGIRVWVKNLITRTTGKGAIDYKKDHASTVAAQGSGRLLDKMHFPGKTPVGVTD